MMKLTALFLFMSLIAPNAFARYVDDVLVRGEITGVDGKFVILALKKRMIMVPRTAILKRFPTRVGENVVARVPASQIKITGNRKRR